MINLVHAEILKLRSTQVWIWLLLAALAIAAIAVIGPLASNGVATPSDVNGMFTSAAVSYLVVFVLGVLGVTTEFRYKTITSTVLTTPSRWAVVSAKLLAYAVVGAVYAVLCLALQLIIAGPWLSAKGINMTAPAAHLPRVLFSVLVVVILFGLIGIGVGALIKNQIVAVIVGIIWLLVVDNLISVIPGVRVIFPYLPSGGLGAVFAQDAGDRNVNGVTLLPWWGGILVLLAWALIPAIIGASLSMTRDIT